MTLLGDWRSQNLDVHTKMDLHKLKEYFEGTASSTKPQLVGN
jgi:hypothetical protein